MLAGGSRWQGSGRHPRGGLAGTTFSLADLGARLAPLFLVRLLTIETPQIAHYAYLIEDAGEAAVVDPRRDVAEYLDVARRLGARIRYVIETHRQEDFVMGSRHLAERAGASVVNGTHQLFGHGDCRLADGDSIRLGNLLLRSIHTPGHTPESVSYAVHTSADADDTWGVFTGDTLFFGTTGRTDLTDESAASEHAGQLYDAIHQKLAPLSETALIFPAHGPGSVCGSGMAPLPFSTLGAEKRYNEVFRLSRAEFCRRKGAERLPRPPYFRHMEQVNLLGGVAPKWREGEVPLLPAKEFADAAQSHTVIDAREPEAFASGHVPGAYNVWMGGLPVFGGWIAEPSTPVYLVTESDREVDEAVLQLSRIGVDGVRGALRGGFSAWRKAGKPMRSSAVLTPTEAEAQRDQWQIVDVREGEEFRAGHIPGARHVYVGDPCPDA